MEIADSAKYLGFYVGPGRRLKTWEAALQKMVDRAEVWGQLGAGMMHTIEAYRVFIVSVIAFIAQLDSLPADFPLVRRR